MNYFGKKVKTYLINKDMSQKELADKLGISEQWISQLLIGGEIPSPQIAQGICRVLGLNTKQALRLIASAKSAEKERLNKKWRAQDEYRDKKK